MTNEEVKTVLRTPYKPLALCALSYVNLSDRDINLLILRCMRGHTQEEAAEELRLSVNGLQKREYAALKTCAEAWDKLLFIQEILKATQ